jgi:hypothetical protein
MRQAYDYLYDAVATHPFNAITLVLTFLLALFAGLSWREAWLAGKSADKVAIEQQKLSAEQLEQMKQQVAAFNALLAPILEITGFRLDDSGTHLTMTFKNSGRSSAERVLVNPQLEIWRSTADKYQKRSILSSMLPDRTIGSVASDTTTESIFVLPDIDKLRACCSYTESDRLRVTGTIEYYFKTILKPVPWCYEIDLTDMRSMDMPDRKRGGVTARGSICLDYP